MRDLAHDHAAFAADADLAFFEARAIALREFKIDYRFQPITAAPPDDQENPNINASLSFQHCANELFPHLVKLHQALLSMYRTERDIIHTGYRGHTTPEANETANQYLDVAIKYYKDTVRKLDHMNVSQIRTMMVTIFGSGELEQRRLEVIRQLDSGDGGGPRLFDTAYDALVVKYVVGANADDPYWREYTHAYYDDDTKFDDDDSAFDESVFDEEE